MPTTNNRLDQRDRIIFDHAPAVMVPNHSPLPSLMHNGHRYLVGRDGVYLDILRDACSIRARISETSIPMPFGEVTNYVTFNFGALRNHLPLFRRFLADARHSLPNEFAAWLVWDNFDRELRYRACKTITASPGRVHFERPVLDRNESLVIDLHSHGTGSAFFSGTDDEDDAGEVKISGVVGNIDRDIPTSAFRICALDVFLDMAFPAEAWK